jgi:hypothetical protein
MPLLAIPRFIHSQVGHRRDHWSRSFPIPSERAVAIRLPIFECVRTSFTHVVCDYVIHAVRPVLAVTMFKLPQSIRLHRHRNCDHRVFPAFETKEHHPCPVHTISISNVNVHQSYLGRGAVNLPNTVVETATANWCCLLREEDLVDRIKPRPVRV